MQKVETDQILLRKIEVCGPVRLSSLRFSGREVPEAFLVKKKNKNELSFFSFVL